MELMIGCVHQGPFRKRGKITERQRVPALKITSDSGAVLLRRASQEELAVIIESPVPEPGITIVRSGLASRSARQMSIPTIGMRKSAQLNHW